MKSNLIKYVFLVFLCGSSSFAFSQNVGINTTGATPSQNAILDLNTGNANNLGLIIPNVTLGASLATFSPPILHAASAADVGMLVYNSVATNQAKGYYFWDGAGWQTIATFPGSNWVLTGNAGTTPSTSLITSPVNNNFIGTTDAKDFVFATNDFERMRITSAGFVGIGTKVPQSKLDDSGSLGVGTINISPAASSSTAIGNGYSTIISTPSAVSTTYTLTLPSATATPRRIYTVVYSGSGKGTIDITSPVAGSIEENGAAVTPFPLAQGTVTFQSDGTNWDIINITSGNTYGSFVGIKYVTATSAAAAFDAGTNSILVKVIGGGGSGGGGTPGGAGACSSITDACGSGGGAGGYVEGFLNGLTGSSTFAVTIGAGGAGVSTCTGNGGNGGVTTLTIANPAYTYTGNGGNGGANNDANNANAYATGGTGGTASSTAPAGTFLTVTGATGASSLISSSGTHEDASGTGAGSPFGPGGSSLSGRSIAEPGVAAVCYGAGGGGAIAAQTNTAEKGGNGFQGVVIIYEYQ